MECFCRSLINPIAIKELQQARSEILLTGVPHEKTHGLIPVMEKEAGSHDKCHLSLDTVALKNIMILKAEWRVHPWAGDQRLAQVRMGAALARNRLRHPKPLMAAS